MASRVMSLKDINGAMPYPYLDLVMVFISSLAWLMTGPLLTPLSSFSTTIPNSLHLSHAGPLSIAQTPKLFSASWPL